MRERPRLAGEVARVANLHAAFLGAFAREALLERLAGLDEARQRAVHAGRKVRAARQQQLVFPADEGHDGGRYPWIGGHLASRAHADPLLALCLCRRATAAAELVAAVPVDELQRPAGE